MLDYEYFYEQYRRAPRNSTNIQKELLDYNSTVSTSASNAWSSSIKRSMTTTYIDGSTLSGLHERPYSVKDSFPKGKSRRKPSIPCEKKINTGDSYISLVPAERTPHEIATARSEKNRSPLSMATTTQGSTLPDVQRKSADSRNHRLYSATVFDDENNDTRYYGRYATARTSGAWDLFFRTFTFGERMTSQKVYRILAFGDSLTEGFHFAGFRYHPYTIKLTELIRNHCEWIYNYSSDRPQIEVRACGRSHECVLDGMIDRLRKTLSDAVEEGHYYRWVIILGGIQDLGCGMKPEVIFDGLKQMYQMVYEHGANLVVMTINETGRLKTNDPRDADRHHLNTLIKTYAWENHWAGGRRTFCVDINAAVPWHRADLDEKKKLWDDHMHLTPKGYDLVGTLIFQAIVDHLDLKNI